MNRFQFNNANQLNKFSLNWNLYRSINAVITLSIFFYSAVNTTYIVHSKHIKSHTYEYNSTYDTTINLDF